MKRQRLLLEAEAIAQANHIALTDKQRAAIKALADQAAANAVNLAAVQMKLSTDLQTPMEIYEKKLRDLIQIQGSDFPLSARKMRLASAQAFQKMQEQMGTVLSTAAGQFSEFFMAFAAGNKAMFVAGKAFAIAQAIINSYLAFTRALTLPLPPPLPEIAAAAALASGLAAVAKIVAQKPPTGGQGRLIHGAGGTTGIDSKLVRMNLAPGERVDVTPANQVNRGGGSLVINPIRPKDFFTGDTVREMVFNIDEWMRNGGTGVRFASDDYYAAAASLRRQHPIFAWNNLVTADNVEASTLRTLICRSTTWPTRRRTLSGAWTATTQTNYLTVFA